MNFYGISIFEVADFIERPLFIDQILEIVRNRIFDFVQLLIAPDSYNDTYITVKEKMKDIKTVIHAPYRTQDIDTGNKNAFIKNTTNLKDTQKFADLLNSDIIVLHPGVGDGEKYLCETIRQFKAFSDPRIAVENLPYSPRSEQLHGSTPENIKRIIEETECKFCFDFSHAICAANSLKRNVYDDFSEYNAMSPVLYHLSDGDFSSPVDDHLHLGKGNYDIAKIFREFITKNIPIALETKEEESDGVAAWIKDIEYIKKMKMTLDE
ncbi:MAG: TIM barrel protein [Holosporaceae bacterium]|jgi:endonuclease IV|nr:TIM barrel protein [Holosporaceae bacterium]